MYFKSTTYNQFFQTAKHLPVARFCIWFTGDIASSLYNDVSRTEMGLGCSGVSTASSANVPSSSNLELGFWNKKNKYKHFNYMSQTTVTRKVQNLLLLALAGSHLFAEHCFIFFKILFGLPIAHTRLKLCRHCMSFWFLRMTFRNGIKLTTESWTSCYSARYPKKGNSWHC